MRWRNTVLKEKANESPNERWGVGSTAITRIFDLADGSYQGRMQAEYDILGYALVLPTNQDNPYYIHRVTPMQYPALNAGGFLPATPGDLNLVGGGSTTPPDFTNQLWAMGTSRTEPIGCPTGGELNVFPAGTTAANYNQARISIEFSTLPYQILTDTVLLLNGGEFNGFPDEGAALANGWQYTRYISRQIQGFSRLIKVPYGLMWLVSFPGTSYANLPKKNKEGIAYRESGANVTYTWYRVPLVAQPQIGNASGVNFSRLQNSQQTLNNANFDVWPAKTLLFDNFKTREYQGAFGERLADVTFNMIFLPHPSTGNNFGPLGNQGGPMQFSPQGWNSVLDVVNGVLDYYPLSASTNTLQPPFGTSDFSTLFRP